LIRVNIKISIGSEILIDFISDWAEQVVLAVIIATILEMLLPQSKNKKYIKMVIGIYILFCIISPFIKNSNSFSVEDIDLSKYYIEENVEVNQESMDKRLQELYLEELEQDITKKVEEFGYKVIKCDVKAILDSNNENAGINKVTLEIEKMVNTNISNVENVEIDINTKENNKEEKGKSEEIEELTEKLSQYYELEEKKINITLK